MGDTLASILGILGHVANVAGPLAFGPDASGINFGAPFEAGSGLAHQGYLKKGLMDVIGKAPVTKDAFGGTSINTQSPDFLSQLTGVDPSLGASMLKTEAHVDPMKAILEAMGIPGTPLNAAKNTQDINNKKTVFDYENDQKSKDKAAQDAQNLLAKKAPLSKDEENTLMGLTQTLTHLQALPDKLPGKMAAAGALQHVPLVGPWAASEVMPDYSKIQEGLQATKTAFASAMPRVRVGPEMLKALTPSFPDPDKPNVWGPTKQQAVARLNLSKLVHLNEYSKNGRTVGGQAGGRSIWEDSGLPPESQQAFDAWQQAFEKHGQAARAAIPGTGYDQAAADQFNKWTHDFGLDSLFINAGK